MSIVSLNRVSLIGNVTSILDIRKKDNIIKEINFTIVTTEHWRDKDSGNPKFKNEYHNIIIKDKALLEVAKGYIGKGLSIYVEGKLCNGNVVLSGPKCSLQIFMSSGQKAALQQNDKF